MWSVRSSTLGRKLVYGVLLLFLIPTLLLGVILFSLSQLGLFQNNPAGLLVALAIGLLVMVAYVVTVAHTLGGSLLRNLHEIQLGTELIATVNPGHRIHVRTGDELESLAAEINRMADRVWEARNHLEREVASATAELEVERGKLSLVLEALGEGVLLATPDGRISLANRAAQELLGPGLLGRSLFDFVDREKVAHFLERLRSGASSAERFSLHLAGGTVLQTAMTPFFDGEHQMVGFILVLRDVTARTRSDQENQRLLAAALQELRNPLSSIRSLSESLLGDPGLASAQAQRLLEAIHTEAVRLSGVVLEMGEPAHLGLARPPWHFEQIAVADLVFMTLRRLKRDDDRAGDGVRIEGSLPALVHIGAEVSTLSGALAHMLRAVLARSPSPSAQLQGDTGETAWLRPKLRGRLVELEVGGPGNGVVSELEALLDSPAVAWASSEVARGGRLSVREVVQQHAGEVWGHVEDGRLGFRLMLPTAEGEHVGSDNEAIVAREDTFVGAGLASGFGEGEDQSERPGFYDFSFFDEIDRQLTPAERDRRLDELSYVVLDTETTGLEPEAGDRIVSIAGVRIRARSVRRAETFDALVNPARRIPAASVKFHGITDAMVAEAPRIDVVLPAFLRFAEDCVLVGHEVSFDLRFIDAASERLGPPGPPIQQGGPSPTFAHPVLDTLLLSEVVHGPLEGHRLEVVAERLGVAVRGRHSALGDALTTAEVFVRLVELLDKRGIRTLGEALDATRQVRGRLATLAGELSE
jgi:DNA polymerase-3 subunit epsilon